MAEEGRAKITLARKRVEFKGGVTPNVWGGRGAMCGDVRRRKNLASKPDKASENRTRIVGGQDAEPRGTVY